MSTKDNEVMVCSKEYDSLFAQLADELAACSARRGGCEHCPLAEDCRSAWDTLMDLRTHYKLKPEDVEHFRDRYINLKKQMVLC